MKPTLVFTLILLIAFHLHLFPYTKKKPVDLENKLISRLNQLKEEIKFPGATLAVILPDETCINISAGVSDRENQRKMKVSDRMFSGSIGKTYVAAVALLLAKEKKINLNDRIKKYFKKSRWINRLPNGNFITIRMLMNHTGGLPRHIFTETFRLSLIKNPDKIWKPEELISHILDQQPVHLPGQGWAYSDTDYILLGMIIEKVTGSAYYRELEKRILRPYRLDRTSPAVSRKPEGLVAGYTGPEIFNFPRKVVKDGYYVVNPQFEWTGGGLITTSLDLARWAKILYGGKVLPPDLQKMMLSPVSTRTGKPDKEGYGLGVQIWATESGLVYGHGGIFPGYQSQMMYSPVYKFSIAMQINIDRTLQEEAKNLPRYLQEFFPIIVGYLKK